MAAEQQDFSGDAVQTTLSDGINDSDLTFDVASTAGWPDTGLPFTVTLDNDNPDLQETVFVRSWEGTTVTLDDVKGRGYDNTVAVAHGEGAPVVHTPDAEWFADMSKRAFAVSTLGDIPVVVTTDGVTMGRIAVGEDGQILEVVEGAPAWTDAPAAAIPLSVVEDAGDLIVGSGDAEVERLATGTTGQVLGIIDGVPGWVAGPRGFLTPIAKDVDYSAVDGDFVIANDPSIEIQAPDPVLGASFGVIAAARGYIATEPIIVAGSGHGDALITQGNPDGVGALYLGQTNAFVVFVCDGDNWQQVGGDIDSGWLAATMENSWVAGDDTPSYRQVGQRIFLKGSMSGGDSATVAFTLPGVPYEPQAEQVVPAVAWPDSGFGLGQVTIGTGGTVTASYTGTLNTFFLDGISFLND